MIHFNRSRIWVYGVPGWAGHIAGAILGTEHMLAVTREGYLWFVYVTPFVILGAGVGIAFEAVIRYCVTLIFGPITDSMDEQISLAMGCAVLSGAITAAVGAVFERLLTGGAIEGAYIGAVLGFLGGAFYVVIESHRERLK
jgi:hypothetical protein